MMSRRGRILLGVCAVGFTASVSAVIGTSLSITVQPVQSQAHAVEEEGPIPTCTDAIADAGGICQGVPEWEATPTPTVEVAPPPAPVTIQAPAEEGDDPAPATEPEGPLVEWHAMDEGPLICGPNAKPALDFNEHTGWGWWAYCEPALVPSEEGPLMGYLPDCPTEDSDNCIWRADERGNGQGQSFIAYDGEVYYLP